MKVKINWEEREIVFKEYTRKIDKWFKTILYKDFNIGIDESTTTAKISPMTLEEANDYLIKALTELTDDEVLSLSNKEYQDLLKECQNIQNPPKKSQESWSNSEKH